MNDYLRQIKACLERGFGAEEFEEAYAIAAKAAGLADRPLSFFVLWGIFFRLERVWGRRPPHVEVLAQMESYLKAAMFDYLDAALAGLSPEVECEYLNNLIRRFQEWDAIQKDIPR